MRRLIASALPLALAGALVVCSPAQTHAQGTGGSPSSAGSSSSSPFGGSPSSGASRPTGSTGGTGGSASAQTYGSTTFLGAYYGTPYAFGVAPSTTGSGTAGGSGSTGSSASATSIGANFGVTGTGTTGGSSTSSPGGSNGSSSSSSTGGVPGPATAVSKFGQPVYSLSKTTTSGTATIKPSTSNQNMQQQGSGIRPAYVAYPGFKPDPVPVGLAEANFREAVLQSTDLSNPNNRIDLVRDGDTLILRGIVEDERERLLAEVLAKMSPGVEGVRNELAVRESSTAQLSPR